MKKLSFVVLLLSVICAAVGAAEVIDTASLLRDLYDLSDLLVLTDSDCRQFSSYDRTGGNDDNGHFLSVSGDTAILAEMKGPGAIVRIWSANPSGTLKIYLDDSPDPVIVTPFMGFYTDPRFQPIRIPSSGGFVSYYPIPYAKSCKVTAQKLETTLYYHVTYQTYGPDLEIKTYTSELGPAQAQLDAALSAWRDPAKAQTANRQDLLDQVKRAFNDKNTKRIGAGKTAVLFNKKGAGCVDEFILKADTTDARALRQATIRMYWDDEKSPSVESPLLDFFGNGFERAHYTAIPFGVEPDGTSYCRFPMPFGRSARIEVENGGGSSLKLEVKISGRELKSLPPDVGRFHAKWRREITKEKIPYLILQAKGKGRFVGVSMTMQSEKGLGFLEGDELIYVDGETQPSFNGTGTEDYFNSGWYFSGGVVSQPLHAATFAEGGEFPRVAAHRFHIPDHVDYRKELTVKIEHGSVCDYPGSVYSSVAYYYNTEPHLEFFKMPPAGDITPPRKPVGDIIPPSPVTSTTPWVIEPEYLKLEAQNGKIEIRSWDQVSANWYGGKVVSFKPNSKSAALVIPFEVEAKDRYAIAAYLVSGKGFGSMAAEVDGKRLPNTPDISSNQEPAPKSRITFGEALLDPGRHVLRIIPLPPYATVGIDRLDLISCSPFISSWYVIGPFDNLDDQGLETPFPPETEPFNPDVTYAGVGGKQVGWREVNISGPIYIQDMMSPNENATAYALTHVVSPDERKVDLLLGSDDYIKVFLNGQAVWQNKVGRSVVPDNDRITVRLNPGVNTLLFKIVQGGGSWGYIARFRDPNGELKYSAKRP